MPSVPDLEWGDAWRAAAACSGVDTELFFPGDSTGEALMRVEQAKEIGRARPCWEACLAFAMRTNQEFGVWGATSEEDRRKMRRYWLTERRALV